MKPIFGHVHEYGYRIEDEQGFEVCFIYENDLEKEFVANDIAAALEAARDRGFEQGIASIRAALGIHQ